MRGGLTGRGGPTLDPAGMKGSGWSGLSLICGLVQGEAPYEPYLLEMGPTGCLSQVADSVNYKCSLSDLKS